MPRTLLLPAVSWIPPKFGLPYFGSAGAHSVLMVFQSASSSSATSIGIEVMTPWPISSIVSMIVTVSSGAILSQTLGSKSSAAAAVPGPPSTRSWRYPPTIRPPPAVAVTLRNVRLSTVCVVAI